MKTVLVINDDADIRVLIHWKLSQAGYTTLILRELPHQMGELATALVATGPKGVQALTRLAQGEDDAAAIAAEALVAAHDLAPALS